METGKLSNIISHEDELKLGVGASQHNRHSRISFKIVSVFEPKQQITIEVRQGKNPNGNYFDGKRLSEIGKELLYSVLPKGWQVLTNTVPYIQAPPSVVNSHWIKAQMSELSISAKQIELDTGATKSEIFDWLSERKPLSQKVQGLMYYYFNFKKLEKSLKIDC